MIGELWLVLRCSSAKTVPLVKALQARGVHAWTPTWKRTRSLPRSNKTRVVILPCIPSFVFVPAVQEGPARHFMRSPHVADFSILDTPRGPILVPDRQLQHLRKIADKPEAEARPLPEVGTDLRFTSGPFEGMTCQVVAVSPNSIEIYVRGFMSQVLKIRPSILFDITA